MHVISSSASKLFIPSKASSLLSPDLSRLVSRPADHLQLPVRIILRRQRLRPFFLLLFLFFQPHREDFLAHLDQDARGARARERLTAVLAGRSRDSRAGPREAAILVSLRSLLLFSLEGVSQQGERPSTGCSAATARQIRRPSSRGRADQSWEAEEGGGGGMEDRRGARDGDEPNGRCVQRWRCSHSLSIF